MRRRAFPHQVHSTFAEHYMSDIEFLVSEEKSEESSFHGNDTAETRIIRQCKNYPPKTELKILYSVACRKELLKYGPLLRRCLLGNEASYSKWSHLITAPIIA